MKRSERLEDTRVVIRTRKSLMDTQHNGQTKHDKDTYNDQQITTKKTKA
jgi:hypothetical protein